MAQAQLLADCLRLESPEERNNRLGCLSAQEWTGVLEQARLLRVEPLLYDALRRLPPLPQLPPGAFDALRQSYLMGLGWNLKRYHQLEPILKALGSAGIPVILLKGAHLAKGVYSDIGLRTMGDLDLLVPRPRLPECARLLEQLGYHPSRPYHLPLEVRRHHHLPPYQLDGVIVELHWSIVFPLSPWEVDLAQLWQRAQPLADLPPALGLSPEDLTLYLSMHLLQDEFALGFKRIYDIALVLERFKATLDLPALQARAQEWELSKGLFLALYQAQELFNAPVDAGFLAALRPRDFSAEIAAMARQRVLTVRPPNPEIIPGVSRLLRRQPLSKKLRRLLLVLFPYPELVTEQYGLPDSSKRAYLYYPVRWMEMLLRFLQQIARLARGEKDAQAEARQENLLSDWYMNP
jgi:hypothetical protein